MTFWSNFEEDLSAPARNENWHDGVRPKQRARLATDEDRLPDTAPQPGESIVTVNVLLLQPLIALIAGILILLIPRLLNFIVAIYLIIIGITGLWPHLLR